MQPCCGRFRTNIPGSYPLAGPDFLDWKTQNHSFQDMAVYGWSQDVNLSGKGEPDHVIGTSVEAHFFCFLALARSWEGPSPSVKMSPAATVSSFLATACGRANSTAIPESLVNRLSSIAANTTSSA